MFLLIKGWFKQSFFTAARIGAHVKVCKKGGKISTRARAANLSQWNSKGQGKKNMYWFLLQNYTDNKFEKLNFMKICFYEDIFCAVNGVHDKFE